MNQGWFEPFYFYQQPVNGPVFPFDQEQQGKIVDKKEEGEVNFFAGDYFSVYQNNNGQYQYDPSTCIGQ